jgi:hypothetical protein
MANQRELVPTGASSFNMIFFRFYSKGDLRKEGARDAVTSPTLCSLAHGAAGNATEANWKPVILNQMESSIRFVDVSINKMF